VVLENSSEIKFCKSDAKPISPGESEISELVVGLWVHYVGKNGRPNGTLDENG